MANPSHALNVFRFGYIKDTNAGQATTPTRAMYGPFSRTSRLSLRAGTLALQQRRIADRAHADLYRLGQLQRACGHLEQTFFHGFSFTANYRFSEALEMTLSIKTTPATVPTTITWELSTVHLSSIVRTPSTRSMYSIFPRAKDTR
jgi:hypothetical protein